MILWRLKVSKVSCIFRYCTPSHRVNEYNSTVIIIIYLEIVPVSLQNNKLISKNGILWYFIVLCAKYLRLDYLILDFYLKQDVYSVWRRINHPVLTDKSQHSLDFIIFYVSSLNGVLIQESELKKTQIHFTPKSNGTRAIYSVWHKKWK